MDLTFTKQKHQILRGFYSESSHKALFLYSVLTNSKGKHDTTFTKYILCIEPIDKKHINVKLMEDSSIISSKKIKGRYKKGYFQIRHWETKFILGPVLWSLTDQLICIGISKEEKLVLVYADGGELLFFLFPVMASQVPDVIHEFNWMK